MAQQGCEPCSGDNNSDTDIESINTEELVMFESTQTFYSNREDMAVIYCLGQAVSSTPKDWIGLFKLGWQTPYDFSTYQWASNSLQPNDQHQLNGRRRKSLFPQADIKKLGGDFQFLYVTGDAQVIGVSESFQVAEKMRHPESPVFVNEEIPKCLSLISLGSSLSSDDSEAAGRKTLWPEDIAPLPVLGKSISREALAETVLTEECQVSPPPPVENSSGQEASLQTVQSEPSAKVKSASAKKSKKSSQWKKPWKKVKAKAAEKVVEQKLPFSYADVVKGKIDTTNQEPPCDGSKVPNNECSKEWQSPSAQPFNAGEQTHVKSAGSVTVVVDIKKPPVLVLEGGQAAGTASNSDIVAAAPAMDNWTLSDFVIGACPAADWSSRKLRVMNLADPDSCYEEYEPLKQLYLSMRQNPCRLLEEVPPANYDNVCGRLSPPCQSEVGSLGKLAFSKEVVLYQHGNDTASAETTPVALPSSVLINALRQAFQKSCFDLYRQKMIESAMEEDANGLGECSPEASSTPSCRIIHGWKTLGDAEEFPMWVLPISELRSSQPSQENMNDPQVGQEHLRECGDKNINYVETGIKKDVEENYKSSIDNSHRSIESNHRSKKGLGLSFISSRLRNLRKRRYVKSSKSERCRGNKTAMLQEALALLTGEQEPVIGLLTEGHDSLDKPNANQDTSRSTPTTLLLNIKSKRRPFFGRKNWKATDQEDDQSHSEETGGDAIIVCNAEERLELLSFALGEALQNNARLTHELNCLQEKLNLALPTTFLTDFLEVRLKGKEVSEETTGQPYPSGNQISVQTNETQSQATVDQMHGHSPSRKTKTMGRATNTEKNLKNAGSNTRVVVTKDTPSQCSKAETVVRSTNTAPAPTRKDAQNNTSVIQKSDAEINTFVISRAESSVQCSRGGAAEATNARPVTKQENHILTDSSGASMPLFSSPTENTEIDRSDFEKWREVCSKKMSRLKKAVSKKKEEFVQLKENAINCEKRMETSEQQLNSLRSVLSVETIKRLKAEKDLDELRLRFWKLLASRQTQPWTPVCQRKALPEISLHPAHADLCQLSTSPPFPDQPKHKACHNHYLKGPVGPCAVSEPHVLTITPFPPLPEETPSNKDVELPFGRDEHKQHGSSFWHCEEVPSVNLALQLLSITQQDDMKKAPKTENASEKKPKCTKISKKARPQQTNSADPQNHLAPSRPKKKMTGAAEEVAAAEAKKTTSSTMSFKRFLMPAMAAIAETFGAAKSRNSRLFSTGSVASLSSINSVSSQDKRFSLSKTSASSTTGHGVAKPSTKNPKADCPGLKVASVQNGNRKRTKRDSGSATEKDQEPTTSASSATSSNVLLGPMTTFDALSHPRTLEKVKIFADNLDPSSTRPAMTSSFSFSRTRGGANDWPVSAPSRSAFAALTDSASLEDRLPKNRGAAPSTKTCATTDDAADSGLQGCTQSRLYECPQGALKDKELSSADVNLGGDKLQTFTEGGLADKHDVITTLPDIIAALVTPTVKSTSLSDEDSQLPMKANPSQDDVAVSRRLEVFPPPSAARLRPPTPIIPSSYPFIPPASIFQLCPASFTRPRPVAMETPPGSPGRAADVSPPRRCLPLSQEAGSLGCHVRRPTKRELSTAGRRGRRLLSRSGNPQDAQSDSSAVAMAAAEAGQFDDAAEHLQVTASAGVVNSEMIPAPSTPVIPEIRITFVKPEPACLPETLVGTLCDPQVVPGSNPVCAGPSASYSYAPSRPERCSPVPAQCRPEFPLGGADHEVKVVDDFGLNGTVGKNYSKTVENASQPLALHAVVSSAHLPTVETRDKLIDIFKTPIQVSESDPAVILCSPFAPQAFLYPPLDSLALQLPVVSAFAPRTTPAQSSPATSTTTTTPSFPSLPGPGSAAADIARPPLMTRPSGAYPTAQCSSLPARPSCEPDAPPHLHCPPSVETLLGGTSGFPPAPTLTSSSQRLRVPALPYALLGHVAHEPRPARPSLEVLTMARQLSVHHQPGRPHQADPAWVTTKRPSPRAFHYDLEVARRDSVGQQMRQGRCLTCGMKFPPAVDRYLVEEHIFFHNVFNE